MRYRPMRFDPEYRPFVAPKCIYIIPLSKDPSHYQVLIPARMTKQLLDLLIQDKLLIRQFRGCPEEAAANIIAQLSRRCSDGPVRYSARMNQLIAAGTLLFVLGIINGTFPDPLPLADEILMIGGGAGIGIAGYLNRKRNFPLLRDKTQRAAQRLDGLECRDDALLSQIYEAIRERGAPTYDRPGLEAVDQFELESQWLVEYLDLHRLLDSNLVTLEEIDALVEALRGAFPLAKFLSLEKRLRRDPKDGRARRARDKTAADFGLSADAFTVYAEFHRLAREIIAEGKQRSAGG